MSFCLYFPVHFLKNDILTQGEAKGNQGELRGVKGCQGESRGIKWSQVESRGVKRSQEETRID